MAVIIKKGKRPQEKEPFNLLFLCPDCACQFVPEYGKDAPLRRDHEDAGQNRSWHTWEMRCPECKNIAYNSRGVLDTDFR